MAQVIPLSRSVCVSLSRFSPFLSDQTHISDTVVCFSFQFFSWALVVSGEVSCVSIMHVPSLCVVNDVSDSPGIYGLLALYGASTCTTTLACVVTIMDTPTTSAATIAQKVISITPEQRVLLLCSYIPFFVIPLWIAVDMALRLQKLASAGIRALESSKEK